MSKKLTTGRGALGERSGSCVQTGSEEPEEAGGKGHGNMATEREEEGDTKKNKLTPAMVVHTRRQPEETGLQVPG